MKKTIKTQIEQTLISNKSKYILIIGQVDYLLRVINTKINNNSTRGIGSTIKKINKCKRNIKNISKDLINDITKVQGLLKSFKEIKND